MNYYYFCLVRIRVRQVRQYRNWGGVLMVRRTSHDKFASVDSTARSPGGPASAGQRALRLSRKRKLSPAAFLQELALRPEFVDGVLLGDLITPEALRLRGQWVVRSQDLLSFHLEFSNLQARPATDSSGAAVLEIAGRGAATITLHFAPQAIAERVFFAATPSGMK